MLKKRCLSLLSVLMLIASLFTGIASAQAEESPIVRVLLRRLNIAQRLDLVLDGVYSVGNPGEASMIFTPGSELTVSLQDGSLYVYYEGMSWNAGESLYLTRWHRSDHAENGLRLQSGENLYEGDLALNAGTDAIEAILHIPMESYLLGVVPYEMSDSFPVEALKAQAVAARTYAARRLNASRSYDVVDTTNDQVFKGRNYSNENARLAVEGTAGMLLYAGDQLAQCYYTASNGGQTEKADKVWGGDEISYLIRQADPHDVANPFSVVKTFKFHKSGGLTQAVTEALAPYLTGFLSLRGFDQQAENIRVDQILSAKLGAPEAEGSQVMTQLALEVKLSGKRRVIPLSQDEEDVLLFATATPAPTPVVAPTASPEPVPSFTDFIPIEESVIITLPLFGTLEQALGLSINSGDNEIITLREEDDAFVLESRRYGHGVGMSQRGAEWMAGHEGMTYQQILSFYYPGTELRQAYEGYSLPVLDTQRLATPGPKPTATPRPTLMPVTEALPDGAWYATVTEIDDDSSLNLRAEPNTGCDILMRLYKGQRLIVLERCEEEGWVKVRTDVVEGFVMASFLTEETNDAAEWTLSPVTE